MNQDSGSSKRDSCRVQASLRADYNQAVNDCLNTAKEMHRRKTTSTEDEIAELRRSIKEMYRAADKVKRKLQKHIAEHGCP